MEWFNAKIKYLKQLENGSIAKVSESYLLNALSFTEAEARLQGILEEYISEYQLKARLPNGWLTIERLLTSLIWPYKSDL